jgi:hypothetical protein
MLSFQITNGSTVPLLVEHGVRSSCCRRLGRLSILRELEFDAIDAPALVQHLLHLQPL